MSTLTVMRDPAMDTDLQCACFQIDTDWRRYWRAMERPDSSFVLDKWAQVLADGAPSDVWGINLNLASPPPETLRVPYTTLAGRLEATLAPAGVYVYPFHCLHITVASLVPFSSNAVTDSAHRAALTAAWISALADTCTTENGFPDAPFELVYGRPTLERAAAIFRIDDTSGSVARIRACVRRAFDTHPALRALAGPDGPLAASDFRIPNIVHTSIMRFVRRPRGDEPVAAMSDDEIRAAFEAAAAAWEPVVVRVGRITIVREDVPYMHVDLGGADKEKELAEVRFEVRP